MIILLNAFNLNFSAHYFFLNEFLKMYGEIVQGVLMVQIFILF